MGFFSSGHMPTFDSFKGKTPALKVDEYFKGDISAWGFLQNRKGEVTRKFTVKMKGTWKGDKGRLEEQFVFDDGEKQERNWELLKTGENTFEGRAGDVVGRAIGRSEGNAINMKYVLAIPVNGKVYNIHINDWLIALDESRMINISSLSKFGFHLGRLTIYFQKRS